MDLNQYQIVLINLDPTIGSEMKKIRPCVIISPYEMNKYLRTIVIAPITNSSKQYPTRIEVNYNKAKGWIVLDQVKTVDHKRIIKVLGELDTNDIAHVKSILRQTYVD